MEPYSHPPHQIQCHQSVLSALNNYINDNSNMKLAKISLSLSQSLFDSIVIDLVPILNH